MTNPITYITADEFAAKLRAGEKLDILDVRSDLEHQNKCLCADAQHIPLHEINFEELAATRPDGAGALYILCKAGPRAEKAAQLLAHYGVSDLVVINGGMTGCEACGADLNKNDGTLTDAEIGESVQQSVQAFLSKFAG